MDEIIYDALCKYYNALEVLGYQSYNKSQKLLILIFYRDFVYQDYRGLISKEDYHLIEKALDCLWGSNCLIPYPNYLKMTKLNLGQISELSQRIKALEEEPVLKLIHDSTTIDNADSHSDVQVILEDD